MYTIDEAESIIRRALGPLVCRIEHGPYNEYLSVSACDVDGNILDTVSAIPSSVFGQKVPLESILISARERISSKGHSLAAWS